eukprot:6171948-Amphidinium_carterae.1
MSPRPTRQQTADTTRWQGRYGRSSSLGKSSLLPGFESISLPHMAHALCPKLASLSTVRLDKMVVELAGPTLHSTQDCPTMRKRRPHKYVRLSDLHGASSV